MEAVQCLTLAAARRGDRVTIKIRGELDFAGIGALIDRVESAIDERVKLCVLDCEQVTFVDSEALKALILLRCHHARVGRIVRVQNCSRQVTRLLTLLGIREQLGCPVEDQIQHSL